MFPLYSLSTRLPVELYVGQHLRGKTPRKFVLACESQGEELTSQISTG